MGQVASQGLLFGSGPTLSSGRQTPALVHGARWELHAYPRRPEGARAACTLFRPFLSNLLDSTASRTASKSRFGGQYLSPSEPFIV